MTAARHVASYALFLYSLCSFGAAYAAEGESSEPEQESKNEFAVFLGVTHEGRRDNSPAVGLEYERRLNETLGIGGLAEFTAGGADFWVFAVPLTIHSDRWKFIFAPGFEYVNGRTEKLFRLGVGYDFKPGGRKITPGLNVDFVDGDAVIIAGVSIGLGF
jgi:hypothetical protein